MKLNTFIKKLAEVKEKEMLLRKNGCFVPCPKCGKDLVSSDSFVEDNDGIVKYECTECKNISFWDFIHFPVPYLRTCGDCHYLTYNSGGGAECCNSKNCNPDTQVNFIDKALYCEYCYGGKALTIGRTDDQGIAIYYPNKLNAYGYDVHGSGSNGLTVNINYCPMCGKYLRKEN